MFKEEDLTRGIIGVAMQLHSELGPGFKENVYHKALHIKLIKAGHIVESEKQFSVFTEQEKVGNFRVDLLVNGRIIVELKSIDTFMPRIFRTQLVSYLKAAQLEVGLLLNFGKPSLEFQRIAHYQNLFSSSQNPSKSNI